MSRMKKTVQRTASLILVALIAFSSCQFLSFAVTEYTEDNYTYSVSGSSATITSFPEKAKGKITIPSTLGGYTVTAIGDYAFCACTLIEEVIIPDTVTSIGNYAFAYCISLKQITIPSSVKVISENAFAYSDSVDIIRDNSVNFADGSSWSDGCTYNYTYSDGMFTGSSVTYSHSIAMMSMVLALSACVPDKGWKLEGDVLVKSHDDDYKDKYPQNIKPLLQKIGFGTQEYYGYNSKPEFDTIACTVASKNTIINNKNTTIIVCAVRGGGYEAEWGGNFKIGASGTNHEGFNTAKDKVLGYINTFVSKHGHAIEDNVIFWVTGYSRAAATSNLVAAVLNNGAKGYSSISALDPSKSNVYAYCFETPQGTTDPNAGSAAYNNIFSIVNPIDPVPYVAPSARGFNFRRYGVTYYLPAAETYKNYNSFKSGMNSIHKQLYKNSYTESFKFYEFKLDWFVWKSKFVETNTMKQMSFVNNLIDILASEVFESRNYYYNHLQSAMAKIIAMTMGGWEDSSENLLELCMNAVLEYFKSLNFLSLSPKAALKSSIATVICSNTSLSYRDAYDLTGELDDVLLTAVMHPNYAATAADCGEKLFYPHYGAVNFAWMAYLETLSESQRSNLLRTDLKYRTYKINCPVDVKVYDSENKLVASIVNNETVGIDGSSISYYVDENGQKCVSLPFDGEYRVEMAATDDGEVNCQIEEFNAETLTTDRVLNYYSMDVETGDVITSVADVKADDSDCDYATTDDNDNEIVASEVLQGEELEKLSVTVSSNAVVENAVIGGGEYIKGEFAKASVIENDAQIFDGWYVDNELVSSEIEYRFLVSENIELEARFTVVPFSISWNVDGTETNELHIFGDEIIKPANPIKEGYIFIGWTPSVPSTMPAYNMTFTAVFEKIPEVDATIAIKNLNNFASINYGETLRLTAVTTNMPEGAEVEWSVQGTGVTFKASADGKTCDVTSTASGTVTVTAKIVDADGEPITDAEGNEISVSQQVKSNAGFFQKLISFFKNLFGISRIFVQFIDQ